MNTFKGDTLQIGIVGCGFRARSIIAQMRTVGLSVIVSAVIDPEWEGAIRDQVSRDADVSQTVICNTTEDMLAVSPLHGIIVGTRCSLHAEYAVNVIKAGVPLFLEKPIATNIRDLNRLQEVSDLYPSAPVVVSFPLRLTPLVQEVRKLIDCGYLGKLSQVQAVNNVPYGIVYYQDWYRDEAETGGLFLQKATHDFDYINHLIGLRPVKIAAVKSSQIYTGDKPAGLKCIVCADNKLCPESPWHPDHLQTQPVTVGDDNRMCAFAEDTGNEDSGSALIIYENGLHVCYTQNFVARGEAGRRGATLIGYDGTVEFDFHRMQLSQINHRPPSVKSGSLNSVGGHGGGDEALVRNFANVCFGRDQSKSPLSAGILSALMCLKARESAETQGFQTVSFD